MNPDPIVLSEHEADGFRYELCVDAQHAAAADENPVTAPVFVRITKLEHRGDGV